MKAVATATTVTARFHRAHRRHRHGRPGSLRRIGYNYMDPQAEEFHKEHPEKPVIGTETVSAVCTRGIYVTDPEQRLRQLLRSLYHDRARLG